MSEIVEVTINGEPVYFETDDAGLITDDVEKVGNEDVATKVAGTFQKALDTVYLVVSATVQKVREFDHAIAPDEFELQFGVKISGEYGAVVAKASGEAQLQIKLTYKHSKTSTEED